MLETIQNWLGTHLGILLDMSPQKFGKNTKDGKVLAKLLYSYGVIPFSVLDKIKESKNYHECFENLLILKPWLEYIGVTSEDSTLQEMAGGEGSASISIFYTVYLYLERKDRLNYYSVQKERRFSEDSCQNRFKVDWVPEMSIKKISQQSSPELAKPLIEQSEIIHFHKDRCKEVAERIKQTKEKFQIIMSKKQIKLGPVISKHANFQPLDKKEVEAMETREKIKTFEKKHSKYFPNLNYAELMELKNVQENQPCTAVPNFKEARAILNNIKKRKKNEVYARNFHIKMQQMVMDEQWKIILEKQDEDFENTVCGNLLKQSQYEKQMANKLSLMRKQKKVLVENRKKIETLKIGLRDKEFDDILLDKVEMRAEDWEDEKFEKERIAELHRRMYHEKVKQRKLIKHKECRKIFEALVDIGIRVSEVREQTSCQVPRSFMKDLKELFFKDLPIFDVLENFEELCDKNNESNENAKGDLSYEGDKYEQMKNEEDERHRILDECDFYDYINLLDPWKVELFFPDNSETEVKHVVLGYVVHKLLAVKYPSPDTPLPVTVRAMKPAAVVQGLTDETACNMLKDLMEACNVLVVQVNDAINFVLAAYKEELSSVKDIDINFQKATAIALKDIAASGKEKEVKKKIQLLKKEEPEKEAVFEEEPLTLDKQTQTPRVLPEHDLLLSPIAEFGKLAFEALGAGDPVPDPVIASAIVAYVSSKQDHYVGWVILNYPLLYVQASELELFLTGYRVLPIIEAMDSLEEVEGFSFRKGLGNPFAADDYTERRVSRLVPKPDQFTVKVEKPKSYFDSFIKLQKVEDSPRKRVEGNSDEWTPLEKFYHDQNILFKVDFVTLNFQAIKNIGKTILREARTSVTGDDVNLTPKNSIEVFGKTVLHLNEKYETSKKKVPPGKETAMRKVMRESVVSEPSVSEEEKKTIEEPVVEKKKPESLASAAKPGDPNWEWASGPLSDSFQVALATLWENMEAVFIEDLKTFFFGLRVHRANVISYSAFIRKSIKTLMRRPDEKQKVLSDFQKMYNDIDEDLRPDVDIKCELHVRVSELEEALMTIAEERKNDFFKDIKKVGQDGWVSDQMATLVNTYLIAMQLEADRAVDSCQVIMDYYTALQQKAPEGKPLEKVFVNKLQIQNLKYSIVSSTSSDKSTVHASKNGESKKSSKGLEQTSKLNNDKLSKSRSWTRKKSSEGSFLPGAAEIITDILVNLSLPDDGLTPFHTFFIENAQFVTNEVKTTIEGCLADVKKGDKAAGKNQKKSSDTKIVTNDNLITEWITALENELSRYVFRIKLILARGLMEMNEFLAAILNTLSSLDEEVNEMHLKEIKSISECCKVFRCAIEEEIKIQPRLELREDEFVVNEDVLLFSTSKEKTHENFQEEHSKHRFTIEQLSLLCQKFQRVAPDGEIIKRSMLFILEDLRILRVEDGNCDCFPEIWGSLQPEDLSFILSEVYQDLEIVHWKDFIIYCLDLPVPTQTDILNMRKAFRDYDPLTTELINRENYDTITFWFEAALDFFTEVDRNEKAKDLLYRMYQVDEHHSNYSALLLAFCKDDNPFVGFTKALSLALGKEIVIKDPAEEFASIEGEGRVNDYDMYDAFSKNTSRQKSYCCSSIHESVHTKCIPKAKLIRCECKNPVKSVSEEEEKEVENIEEDVLSEQGGESLFNYNSEAFKLSATASSVPHNILFSLLKVSYPSLSRLSVLLDCKQTFQESVNSVYDSLESPDGNLEVHKLLHHNFISRLLNSTNKFKFIKLENVLLSVVEFKNSMGLSSCSPVKLNFNFGLN